MYLYSWEPRCLECDSDLWMLRSSQYPNLSNIYRKKELPASETLYQALKKCHYTRKVCERQVDTLCERIKDLHLHALSGLMTSHLHQDE